MYRTSLNGSESRPVQPTTKGLQKYVAVIKQSLQDIFTNTETPEKIYTFCQELSSICLNEFITQQNIYAGEKDSSLYVDTIRQKIIEYTTQKCLKQGCYFIPNFLGVSGIPSYELDQRDDIRLIHTLDPNKYYSIEHMTLSFPISKKHAKVLLDKMTPVSKEYKRNRLTEMHFGLNYYMLGDKLLIHNPGTDTFYYDMIALIKETSFSDTAMIDPLQVRKLVGVCQPFIEHKKQPGTLKAITDTAGGKVIQLRK